jgi:hypothetical protein
MNSTISTPFLSQKTDAISFLAGNIYLNFLSCLVNVCVSPATQTMCLRNSSPSLRYLSKNIKAQIILCILCALMSIFRTHLAQYLWYPSLTVIISENSVWNLWEFTRKFWNCKTLFHKFFCQYFEQYHHLLQTASYFTLNCEYLLSHLWAFYTIVWQFLFPLHFGRKLLHIIHNRFLQNSCF